MKLPLQVSSRNIYLSQAAENAIIGKAEKLETFYNHIMGCRVHVEAPHRHKHQGVLYNVRIDMTVPGAELVAKRGAHSDLYVAIRDAFDAVRRQLQEYVRKQRDKKVPREELEQRAKFLEESTMQAPDKVDP
ncbi:MAG: ribosome-associated translation inhibitor RaiA [Gammaproteobacteria bacterium]|nr:ribosome-associated translation inhibitor RaiA [Gammaproteobacteria bacterium]